MNYIFLFLAIALINPLTFAATSSPDLYRTHYIAAGLSVSGDLETIVSLTSDDAGQSWIPSTIPPASTSSMQNHIDAISCDQAAQHCVAVGDSDGFTLAAHTSDDGGRTWRWATIQPSQGLPSISSVACDAKAMNCVAVGEYGLLGTVPLIYYSNDKGNNWLQSPGAATQGVQNLSSVSCDSKAINCVAVGNSVVYTLHAVNKFPFTFITNDGGLSWSEPKQQPSSMSVDNVLHSVSCSNNGKHCVTVGCYYRDVGHRGSKPLVYVSDDGGQSWDFSEITPAPEITHSCLSSVSCDGKGQSCVAAGTISIPRELSLPMIYRSGDGGRSWTLVSHSPADIYHSLDNVLCTKNGKQCLITGIATNPERLITYLSKDGGLNWSFASTYLENRYHKLHLA